jgi:glyoxylase-like metal-dependent hydrolase (beta-lactamase superfamily II)
VNFTEVGAGVFVLRYPVLDVNIGLVVGGEAAAVVDTLSTDAQAGELLDAARRVTARPLRVINTHHHFDHTFGNAVLAAHGAPIWAQEEAAALLRTRGELLRRQWCAEYEANHPDLAEAMRRVHLRPPDHTVHLTHALDLGDRTVQLRHFGRGHTAGDLVVLVPDAGVAFAGDLVEESGPPQFHDAYPLDWPDTLAALLDAVDEDTSVVPGHGAVVKTAFVTAQRDQLTALDWLIRDGDADGAPIERVVEAAPFDPETARVAVRRGYDQLSGKA